MLSAAGQGAWDRRICRADELAAANGATASLLGFYRQLLRQQKAIHQTFADRALEGTIDADATRIAEAADSLWRAVAACGPDALAGQARTLLDASLAVRVEELNGYWHDRSDRRFFAKALFQPYCQLIAENGTTRFFTPSGNDSRQQSCCPRCAGAPQASILEAAAAADGSTRRLLCATCLTTWPFRRVVCPACGEEDERKMAYYRAPELDHLRVDACERCGNYLKSIDLGRSGLADPLVDEAAGAALDLWARARGYQKIELNLLGL